MGFYCTYIFKSWINFVNAWKSYWATATIGEHLTPPHLHQHKRERLHLKTHIQKLIDNHCYSAILQRPISIKANVISLALQAPTNELVSLNQTLFLHNLAELSEEKGLVTQDYKWASLPNSRTRLGTDFKFYKSAVLIFL